MRDVEAGLRPSVCAHSRRREPRADSNLTRRDLLTAAKVATLATAIGLVVNATDPRGYELSLPAVITLAVATVLLLESVAGSRRRLGLGVGAASLVTAAVDGISAVAGSVLLAAAAVGVYVATGKER